MKNNPRGFVFLCLIFTIVFTVFVGCKKEEAAPERHLKATEVPAPKTDPWKVITIGSLNGKSVKADWKMEKKGEKAELPVEEVDPWEAIEKIIGQMRPANISFNTPEVMKFKEENNLELKLSLEKSVEELSKMITSKGKKEGTSIKVYTSMEAMLTGSGFSITAITPEMQTITPKDVTTWQWCVVPVLEGKQKLHLTLNAVFKVNGSERRHSIRTFDKEIFVEVTLMQRFSEFIDNNKSWLQWSWSALFVPLGGWLWVQWKRKKK